MRFSKMQGIGNDYVYLDCTRTTPDSLPKLAIKMADRHFGIGSDGLICICPSDKADFRMRMFNADGSEGEMCGNGIRCVAKFVYDKGLTDSEHISVVSAGQIKYLSMVIARQHPWDRGTVRKVRVNMGSPILRPELIPVMPGDSVGEVAEAAPADTGSVREMKTVVVNEPIEVKGKQYRMTCVSMGNPHAVIFADDVRNLDLEHIGPAFESHERFPRRVNTEFVEVLDRQSVFMRVWERGAGETLACGTGCCAAAVACVLNGLTDDRITVKLLGGELQIEWDRDQDLVYMTGPAEIVFEGEVSVICAV